MIGLVLFLTIPTLFVGFCLGWLLRPMPKPVPIDPNMITLHRMAIRLSILSHEGCFSQSGGVVYLDFHGDAAAANECLDAIMAVIGTAD